MSRLFDQTKRGFTTIRSPRHNAGPLTIAIVGCGAIVKSFYLPAIAKYPAIRLWLVDRERERARKLAESDVRVLGCLDNYREVTDKVDGAIVAVPHELHHEVSLAFLRQGVHVLCEKPLALSPQEGREMVVQAERSKVTLHVNNTRRLYPAYQKIKELLSNGALGALRTIKYTEGWEFSWLAASEFRFNSKGRGGGVLMDTGAHVLDLICWWLGEKPALISCEHDSFGGIEAVALIKFQFGSCSGEIKLSWLSKLQNQYEVVGELGAVKNNVDEWGYIRIERAGGRSSKLRLRPLVRHYNAFADILVRNFFETITGIAEPLIPAQHVLPSLEFLEDCHTAGSRFHMPWLVKLGGSC